MGFICKGVIYFSSILVLLSTTICAVYSGAEFENKNIKSATFISEMFEMGPGKVAAKTFYDVEFPKGHVGIKSFDAELVDEEGNSVPLYEAYLHHWFAIKYQEKDWNMSKIIPKDPMEGAIYIRNDGTCNTYILPIYWGLGAESRGTKSKIPDPYAVEHGNPSKIPFGYQEKWLLNLLIIDTRGTEDREGCTECRCDHFNLPTNFYNVTVGIDGKPLGSSYKGGLFCCQDNLQCKLQKDFEAPTRKLALRYKITWVDWNQQQIPLRFYVLDSTDRVRTNGSQFIHDCQVEFTVPPTNGRNNAPHIEKANIPMERGGYLIYGTAHMHRGAINATLYGQDGRILYTSKPKYGKGKKPGNEKGYVVGMSGSYPELGSTKIKDGEIVTIETRYESGFRTGAMGHMYIYLADRLPDNTNTPTMA
ncbi:unnamed protein product [Trifolium pratense]|uniref:Uncharacterized protein n=2 Tax=Trifolium pratense TaxID=57577 RepID=A0ACB0KNP4_TRIPR|nr:unnamed protein product [Trifolium pratense]